LRRIESTSKLRLISIGACLVFVAWFAVFGGEVFGPVIDAKREDGQFRQFLTSCPRDEVRLEFYTVRKRLVQMTLDLTTQKLSAQGFELTGPWTLFWMRKSVWLNTVDAPVRAAPISYTDSVLQDLQHSLNVLPVSSDDNFAFQRDQYHVAFWRGNELHISNCSQNEAQNEHADLLRMLGISFTGR